MFGGALGVSFGYVIYWGIPQGWAWIIAILSVIVFTLVVVGVASDSD